MASFNKVIMAGNLTRDPELSYLPSQTPVCEFGLAVNRKWKDKQTGQQKDAVCFIDCRAYGPKADTLQKYMTKGKPILVEGRLELDNWEGKDGQKRSKHRIFVENFTFMGGQGDGESQGNREPAPANRQPSPQQPAQQATPPPPAPEPAPPQYEDGGEEIPF